MARISYSFPRVTNCTSRSNCVNRRNDLQSERTSCLNRGNGLESQFLIIVYFCLIWRSPYRFRGFVWTNSRRRWINYCLNESNSINKIIKYNALNACMQDASLMIIDNHKNWRRQRNLQTAHVIKSRKREGVMIR